MTMAMSETGTTKRVSLDLGEGLFQAIERASKQLGCSKADTLRRAAIYLTRAMEDESQGYCVGSWKESDEKIERNRYFLTL